MQLPKPIQNLLDQARLTSRAGTRRMVTLQATIITPTQHIPLIIPTGMAELCQFDINNSDDAKITGGLQPGVYMNNVLPYKDNLVMEVIEREGLKQTVKAYQCTPLADNNPSAGGGHSALGDMNALNNRNILTLHFQLLDPGFAVLKNKMVDGIPLMAKLDDVLHNFLTVSGEELEFTGPNAFRGVDIESPIDNQKIFSQVVIPQGVRLIKLAEYLQNDDHFGFYSKGQGCYYRKGMWYVYPLYKLGRYKTAPLVLDIYKVPEDVIPTLDVSFYVNDRAITVISTGPGQQHGNTDIRKQNRGTGTRVISPDAIAGESGNYYGKGVALTTRQDSISEFRTSQRAGDNDIVPFDPKPKANIWAAMTMNAYNDGERVFVEWHNSQAALLVPGMPVRYYFMDGESLKYQEGTLLGARKEWQRDAQNTNGVFKEITKLELFLLPGDDE